jgi:hypothetical protein
MKELSFEELMMMNIDELNDYIENLMVWYDKYCGKISAVIMHKKESEVKP